MYKIEKDYRDNEKLRHSFNKLAEKTFGLSFEDWYQNGFWGDNYNPYSIIIDGKVVANVSVNKTDMLIDGDIKHFIQLGTVMTDENYRNKGLIREIMDEIDADYRGRVDGVYLFANDSVLNFYPKFGFQKCVEYKYSKKVHNTLENQLEKVVMNNPEAWKQLKDTMNNNVFHGKFDMINNHELIMFYVSKFMMESVFYHKETDTYIIADIEGEKLFIHNVFSRTMKALRDVIELFGKDINEVTFGFVPLDAENYNVMEFHEEDTTFFIKGEGMKIVEREKLRIPSLSHA